MIAITNITAPGDLSDHVHRYEVSINGAAFCQFLHFPNEGLARCFEEAAEAVRRTQEFEYRSRLNEKNPPDQEEPDEKDGLRSEEAAAAEANQAEANLEEKDRLAGEIQGTEVGPRGDALLWALRLADYHREKCELASSKRAQNPGFTADDHPCVRGPLPPLDSCEPEQGDGAGSASPGIPGTIRLCTCVTKSPEIGYHAKDCEYRIDVEREAKNLHFP